MSGRRAAISRWRASIRRCTQTSGPAKEIAHMRPVTTMP